MVRTPLSLIVLALMIGQCKGKTDSAAGFRSQDHKESEANSDASPSSTEPDNKAPSEDTIIIDDKDGPGRTVQAGVLPASWIHGAQNCNGNTDPAIQVHKYNEELYILRQNKCLNYEAPFMYLLLGKDKALLIDTGATGAAAQFPLRTEVEKILTTFLKDRARTNYSLVVMHSHGHGDHVAADGQFQNQPGTTLVTASVAALQNFFSIANWPTDTATYDLGERPVTIIPIPGHQDAHVAVFDVKTGILFSGDSLYPGRLYISTWEVYRGSIDRLAQFTQGKLIAHILGAHIEMTSTAGMDYPIGTTFQPNEHVLQLPAAQLTELNNALKAIGTTPKREVHDSFIISP